MDKFGFLIALIPALFMTMVCTSYILIAPEGFDLPIEQRWIGYVVAGIVTFVCLDIFFLWAKRHK